MARPNARRGITAVEVAVLLVVAVLLLALVVMYLPQANAAKRRMLCAERLRALSQATLQFHQLEERFPGYRAILTPSERCVAWPVLLFPPLDRTTLYTAWSTAEAPPAPHLAELICPSTPAEPAEGPALSYVANAGGAERAELSSGVFFDHCPFDPADSLVMTLDYLTEHDGAEKTLMLSEHRRPAKWNALEPEAAEVGFLWYPDEQAETPLALAARPSSYHPGGFQVTYCDGHGDFLSYEIDGRVYRQLMTPASEVALGL